MTSNFAPGSLEPFTGLSLSMNRVAEPVASAMVRVVLLVEIGFGGAGGQVPLVMCTPFTRTSRPSLPSWLSIGTNSLLTSVQVMGSRSGGTVDGPRFVTVIAAAHASI